MNPETGEGRGSRRARRGGARAKDRPAQREAGSERRHGAARRSRGRALASRAAVIGVAVVAVALALNALGVFRPNVGESFPDLGRAHLSPGQSAHYNSIPPTSGPHANPVGWGAYTARVPDENVVHNLEHGGIAIAYNAVSPDDVERLKSWLTTYPRDRHGNVKLVIHPDERLAPGTIVLTAWTRLLKLGSYDASLIRSFIDANMDRCCESVA